MEARSKFAFSRINYIIMLIGIGVLLIGFFIMTQDTETFGFGFLGLTLGPIVVMIGFLIQFIAIFYKEKAKKGDGQEKDK